MQLGMLDIGSNSVKLQVVDARAGAPPLPVYAWKAPIRLSESTNSEAEISEKAIRTVTETVSEAMRVAEAHELSELIAFATAWLRDASNSAEVHDRLEKATGEAIIQLTGQDEARLAFLAVRRWYGWSAGRLLLLDIGGGSLEIAYGRDEEPELAVSLPLGAGRITHQYLHDDPPSADQLEQAARAARSSISQVAHRLRWEGIPSVVVATSKTFKQLARVTGAPAGRKGPFIKRSLRRSELERWTRTLSAMTAEDRAAVRGVAPSRCRQIVGGAIVAEAAMRVLDIAELDVCPWALREGVLLRRLDRLDDPAEDHDLSLIRAATMLDKRDTTVARQRRQSAADIPGDDRDVVGLSSRSG
jgi:exopolyphosphatase/guanosine-5'-triphosphate,3'-diphosphate pyrophosphatase